MYWKFAVQCEQLFTCSFTGNIVKKIRHLKEVVLLLFFQKLTIKIKLIVINHTKYAYIYTDYKSYDYIRAAWPTAKQNNMTIIRFHNQQEIKTHIQQSQSELLTAKQNE